jgi:hypothetical protein
MTIDIPRATRILQEALLRDLGDEVDLIFLCGSQLTGATHRYSDLDLLFVPVHESTAHSITVMVNDVMIDFYSMHWSSLERMASFDDVANTVLLQSQIVYQRTAESGTRFLSLPDRLAELQRPTARPHMVRKALDIFQQTGYSYYLLCEQATRGHGLSCMQQARDILNRVVHSLCVCNQACVDSRRLDQVLALPKLPEGFAETVDRVTRSSDCDELMAACDALVRSTRELLHDEQRQVLIGAKGFPTVCDSAYPELKGALQHIMLACERRDRYGMGLTSLYHELMIHTSRALTGVEYSRFNCIADYEQDLGALGFPDLLGPLIDEDFDLLQQRCTAFDLRMQEFLTERSVPLNSFASLDELQEHLGVG